MKDRSLYEKSLIIAPRSRQEELLSFRASHPEADFKLMRKEDVLSYRDFRHDERAEKYLLAQGKGLGETEELLHALAKFDPNKTYKSENLNALKPLFQTLSEKGYLYRDAIPEQTFASRHILISGYQVASPISRALSEVPSLDTAFDFTRNEDRKVPVYAFDSMIGEVHEVCSRIAESLEKGQDIRNIYLANYDPKYRFLLTLFSAEYGFSFALPSATPFYSLPLGKAFLVAYARQENVEKALEEIQGVYGEEEDFTALCLLAKTYEIEGISKKRQIQIYRELLKKKKAKENLPFPAVRILQDYYAKEGSEVYFLDFALGSAPKTFSDGALFRPEELAELGFPSVLERNEEEKEELLGLLRQKEVVFLSYHEKHIDAINHPSPLLSENRGFYLEKPPLREKEYSHIYASLYGQSMNDRKAKYGVDDPLLPYYEDKDRVPYDHSMGLKRGSYSLKGRRVYSYSALDSYFRCPFRYYLSKVLRVGEGPSGFSQILGLVAHKTLENFLPGEEADFDAFFDSAITEVTAEEGVSLNAKEQFFIKQYKDDLRKVASFIKEKESRIENRHYRLEFEAKATLQGDTGLYGEIDKAISFGPNEENLAIIDYKNYGKTFNENLLPFGLDLQLPTYALLASLDDEMKDQNLAGLFISPVFLKKGANADPANFGKDLRLQGVFISDKEVLERFDPTYVKSDYVAGLSINKDGGFAYVNRVRTPQELKEMASVAKKKILEADARIRDFDFPISPVKCESPQVDGCDHCPFGAICFASVNDFRYIKVKKEEGEE